jgi:Tfp pilus assembly protein PilF
VQRVPRLYHTKPHQLPNKTTNFAFFTKSQGLPALQALENNFASCYACRNLALPAKETTMTNEELQHQLKLLESYREYARISIEQIVKFGNQPPIHLVTGLEEAQKEIRKIKLALRDANQPFENLPSDGEPVEQNHAPRVGAAQLDVADAQQQFEQMPLDEIPTVAALPPNSRIELEPNRIFVGREQDFRMLVKQLKQGKVSVIIAGIGGIGKTQLAVELAYRYGQYFAGGVYWVSFADLNAIPSEIAECGIAMGLYDESYKLSQAEQVQLTRKAWDSPLPRLLIFDNCDEQAQVDAEKLLLDYLPKAQSGSRVLVTSRRGHWSRKVAQHTLESLSRDQSIMLLQEYCDWLNDAEAGAIAHELGDLPLALHLAGAFLDEYQGERFAQPANYLKDIQAQRAKHPSLNQSEQSIIASFELSFQRLDQQRDALALAALARAACFAPGELFPRALLSTSLQNDNEELAVANAIQRLIKLGLLERSGENLRLHRLLASYIQTELADPQAQADIEAVLIDTTHSLVHDGFPSKLQPILPHLYHCYRAIEQQDTERNASLAMALGRAEYKQHNYRQAEPLLERALRIHEQTLGAEHPNTATSLNNLAELYRAQGRYGEAEPLFERALRITETALGAEHPDNAQCLNNLAALFYAQGWYGEAEPLLERALRIYETALGAEHPHTATSLGNLAELYRAQGRYGEAEPLYLRALRIYETALGAEHPTTAAALNNLAGLYESQGRYGEAEPLMERALRIREQALGAEHPDTAQSLNNLAGLYQAQGRYGEAEPLYLRALRIYETALGAEHPHTATSLNNLASLYESQGRYGEAEPLLERALRIREQALGAEHPDTAQSLNNLAGLYESQGRYGEAEPLMERALHIHEQVLGAEHPHTATSLNNLASLYESQGRYGEAEPLFERALRITETTLGAEHPDTAQLLKNLIINYILQGHLIKARVFLHSKRFIYKQELKNQSANPASIQRSIKGISQLLQHLNQRPTRKR